MNNHALAPDRSTDGNNSDRLSRTATAEKDIRIERHFEQLTKSMSFFPLSSAMIGNGAVIKVSL
jgi:hypothetical protein